MRTARWFALPCLLLALAACEDSGERAESFFEDGVELREAGDLDRAAVSFRNVFRFDGTHKEARTQLAEVLVELGNPNAAFSQYLRLAEQYPDDVEVRLALADLAVRQQAWSELRRHGTVAVEAGGDRPETRAIAAMIAYVEATEAEDEAAQQEAIADAEALLEDRPDLDTARRLAIIGNLQAERYEASLFHIDAALERLPGDRTLSLGKLQVLSALQREEEVEDLLVSLYELFPEDDEIRSALIAWYVQREDLAAVEEILRARAGPLDGPADDHVTLVQFLSESQGVPAARSALAALMAANADTPEKVDRYAQIDAAYALATGDVDGATDLLRARLDDEADTPRTDDLKTMLARILISTGDQVGARALVEEVLASDAGNVDALKMQARWLIEAEQPNEAITALRAALDQAPNDPDILTLMARAHLRAGSVELAGERLALAVDLSDNAPEESLRYVRFLLDRDRTAAARAQLSETLRVHPRNVEVLTEQARLSLSEGDAAGARAVIATLSAIEGDPAASDRARALSAALLLDQQRFDEGIALLEERAQLSGSGRLALDVVRTRLRAGQSEEARAYLAERLAETPDDPALRFADAVLNVADGETADAESDLRTLIEDFPQAQAPVQQLYALLRREGRDEEAERLLTDAIDRIDGAIELRFLFASTLEAAGELEGALTAYEAIYEIDSENIIAANNYASLLSDLRTDDESLERAAAIARRLSESRNPAFQDTYGWIAYRQGNYAEALEYLQPAADGLPDNAVVFYHLGMTYLALERTEDARKALSRALALGEGQPLPQIDQARQTLEGL